MDLPEDLYRTLKARAAIQGLTVRELVRRLIEQGLRQASVDETSVRHGPPPVIIPPRGVPIPALPRAKLHRLEEEEDEERHGRFAGR